MTFFFDRTFGVKFPQALQLLSLPVGIEYHQAHFEQAAPDDYWLPIVGTYGWIVVSQDYSYHEKETELAAIKQYNMGCFYLWGSEAGKWEIMRVFAKAFDKMVNKADVGLRPFVFDVNRRGWLAGASDMSEKKKHEDTTTSLHPRTFREALKELVDAPLRSRPTETLAGRSSR